MQILNQENKNKNKGIKKSWLFLLGSLLVIIGVISLSANHIKKLRLEVFSDMLIRLSSGNEPTTIEDVPEADTVSDGTEVQPEENKPIDYSKYLGVLEIPRISLKRGFYGLNSKYNNIEQNVTLVQGSKMPDVRTGNLILMAHSGDAYVSFFAYLFKLKIGDSAYITYNGNKYTYKIVNIYDVPKNGTVEIFRNYDMTTLTLITCTKNDDTKQTVYIAELVS